MRGVVVLIVLIGTVILSGCLEERYEDLDIPENCNSQVMENRLNVVNPEIWNSLAAQTISPEDSIEEFSTLALRSSKTLKEYPSSKTYYYALFEDLYPSKGDYDFNDVVIKSKMFLGASKGKAYGYFDSELINKGGSLSIELGLMFYSEDKGTYTRVANKDIKINGEILKGEEAWSFILDSPTWRIDFEFEYDKNLWVNYFIKSQNGEIMSAGMAPSNVKNFKLPHKAFLTNANLPWGLEIEAEEFAVPNEKVLFLDAYPMFEDWINSGGSSKYKKWFENPNLKNTRAPL